eukprot:CAMPEP_0174972034 /NCGR_PEP_ID=MMETSP0004_2-20121128/10384_1 /TAXON_ID=420556 /ORGANISM="Ochromonas sp., Strain CCMP1393" /LENGTH=74 /DNA_ID=CAMNT_0016222171 /DNA_START=16 /DNA_END=237 /DNA_ORIENTATION=-
MTSSSSSSSSSTGGSGAETARASSRSTGSSCLLRVVHSRGEANVCRINALFFQATARILFVPSLHAQLVVDGRH